jgi:hypothetical protein
MPTLQEILRDPNFVNANPATKQAIFDRWAPQDPNYSGANGATQQAIRERFGVGGGFAPAPVEEKPVEDAGFFSNVGNLLVEGGQRALSAAEISPSVIAGTVGPGQAATITEELARKPKVQPKALTQAIKAFEDEAADFKKAEGFIESTGPVLRMIGEFGRQVITNPAGAVYLTSQSAANMVPAIAAGLAFGKAGTMVAGPMGGAVGFAGGMFAGSAPLEAGMEFTSLVGEELSRLNLPPTEANVARVLANEKFVEKAVGEARTKGATTAAIDAAFTAGAGRFATAPGRAAVREATAELGEKATKELVAKRADELLKSRTFMDKVGRGAGAVGIDVAGGGLSEAGGQLAAYGEVDLADVGLEMLGELGGSAIEIPSAIRSMREPRITSGPTETPIPEDLPPIPEQTAAPIESVQVERFPLGTITEEDIAATGVEVPSGFIPFLRRDLIGKTREDLQAYVDENPEVLENDSVRSRVIRSLLQPPAAAPDQPSVGLPVQRPAEPAAGIEPPQLGAVAGIGQPIESPVVPQAPVTPTVTETPRGTTTPQAIEAETQGQEDTDAEPFADIELPATPEESWNQMSQETRLKAAEQAGIANPKNLSNKNWGALSKNMRGRLEKAIASQQAVPFEETAPRQAQPRRPSEPKVPTIPPAENPQNIGALPNTTWEPGTTPETSLVSDGAVPFRNKTEARAAKRLQPDMRVIKVPGGFVLSPKTEAQMEADRKAGERLGRARVGEAGRPLNAMQFIVDAGGLSRSAANNVPGVDPGRNMRVGNRWLVTQNGMSLDKAAELLKQNGYIDEESEAAAANALGNPNSYTPEGFNRLIEIEQAEREAEDAEIARMEEEEMAQWADFVEDPDSYLNTGYEEALAEIKAEVREILDRAEELNIDPEEIYENANARARDRAQQRGRESVTDEDYILSAREELRDVLSRSPEDRRSRVGKPSEAIRDPEVTAVVSSDRDMATILDMLQFLARRKKTDSALSQILDALPTGSSLEPRMGRVAWEVHTNSAASDATKQRAKQIYENALAPQGDEDLELAPPTPEAQAEAERRAAQAPADQEREQIRRESEVGAGQFRLEGGEGRQDISGTLFQREESTPPGIPANLWQQHLKAREAEARAEGTTTSQVKTAATRTWRALSKMAKDFTGSDQAAQDLLAKMNTISGIRDAIRDEDSSVLAMYEVMSPDLYAQEVGGDQDLSGSLFQQEGITDTIEVDGKERPVRNADGRLIESTPDKLRNFWKFFGDSEVVDAKGRPLVVYHGTAADFSEFAEEKLGINTRDEEGELGFFFTAKPFLSDSYAQIASKGGWSKKTGGGTPVVYPVYLSIKNPKRYETASSFYRDAEKFKGRLNQWRKELEAEGFDGVIVRDDFEEVIAFRPTQIKSAIGNTGTYGAEAEGILEQRTEQGGWAIDPEEQKLEKELKGKDFMQVAQWAVDNAPNALAKTIATKVQTRLKEFQRRGVVLDFRLHTGDRRPLLMSNARGSLNWSAAKDKPLSLTLNLNGAAAVENQSGYPPGMRYQTVLHELIHGATAVQIYFMKDSPLVKQLNGLRNTLVKEFNARQKRGTLTPFEQKIYNRSINALQNNDEVLAWGLTDRDMQEFMADIKVGEQSLFDKFVEIIQKILNLGRPYRSALEDLIRTGDALLDISTDDIAGAVEQKYLFGPADPRIDTTEMVQGTLFQQEGSIAPEQQKAIDRQEANVPSIWGGNIKPAFVVDEEVNWFEKYVMQPLINRNYDVRNVYDSIKKAKIDLDKRFDFNELEITASAMEAQMEKDFLQDEVDPLIKEMMDKNVEMEDIHNYALAMHAEERNREVARRNPRMPDGGSGMTTKEANDYLDSLSPERKKVLESIRQRLNDIQDMTREIVVSTGQEPQSKIDAWTKNFRNYVPLFREEMEYDDMKMPGQGTGVSVRGDFSRSFTGSSKPVQDVFASIIAQRQRAIARGMKMRMGRGIFGAALTAPAPDFWMAVDPRSTKTVTVKKYEEELAMIKAELDAGVADPVRRQKLEDRIPVLEKRIERLAPEAQKELDDMIGALANFGFSGEEVSNLIAQPFEAVYSPTSGMVEYRANKLLQTPYVVVTRINGEEVYTFFNKQKERARRMAEQLHNMGTEPMDLFNRILAPITRFFAAINTQYNPLWGMYNYLRDSQTAAIQAGGTVIEDSKMKVVKDGFSNLSGIYKMLRDERKGVKSQTPVAKAFRELREEGGITGFKDNFSRQEDRVKALADQMKLARSGKLKKFAVNNIAGLVSDFNQALENSIRLAAYMEAKKKYVAQYMAEGMSKEAAELRAKQPSAVVAKQITVNFNQKGGLNAKIGSLYAFFNAAMQGLAAAGKAMFTWDKPGDFKSLRLTPMGKKVMMGGLMWGAMQPLLMIMGGVDPDDLEEFQKERNFIIPLGNGKVFTFPMPFVFSMIPNTSRLMTEWFLNDMKDPGKYLTNFASAAVNSFNPFGGSLDVLTFTPTPFKPIVALDRNVDAFGRPIARESFNESQQIPGYTMAKDSASAFGKIIAEYVNYLSGGTKDVAGKLNWTPDQVDYFVGQLTGGIGREALKTMQVTEGLFTGEATPFYKYPLIGRFGLDVKEGGAIAQKFYSNLTKLNAYENTIKGMAERREPLKPYLDENPLARMYKQANIMEREIQKLRRTMRQFKEKGDKENVKRIQEQIKERMRVFNEMVRKAEGA